MSGRGRGPMPLAVLATAGLLAGSVLSGCSGGGSTTPGASADRTSSTSAPAPTRAPTPPPAPEPGACYRLGYDAALAPTSEATAVACGSGHTSQTYAVGRLRTEVDGHLLAIDSDTVQQQVADTCPRRLAAYLGATPDQLRLSLLRPVWFTPTVAQSDAGAAWYRCDVIAVVGEGEAAGQDGIGQRLAGFSGDLEDALASARTRSAYAMCASDQPGTADFQRVLCRDPHTWKAIRTVELSGLAKKSGGRFPGEPAVRSAGDDGVCADAARAIAADALDYQWGYEWPTSEQWQAGQTYGRCWAPDPASGP